jgi:hypothetical protein
MQPEISTVRVLWTLTGPTPAVGAWESIPPNNSLSSTFRRPRDTHLGPAYAAGMPRTVTFQRCLPGHDGLYSMPVDK